MASVLRYAIRMDVIDSMRQRISDWLSANGNGFICVKEVSGDNHHVHIILDSVKAIKVLRSSLVRAFPECVGNKGYSLKVCDDDYDAYIRYICKGEPGVPPVVWCKQGLHYTAEHIESAHERYWVNNEALQENARKRVKVEKENIVEQVEKIAKKEGLKGYDREGVAKVYIRLFRDARKGINVFAARAVVNTVCCLLDGSGEDHLAQKIAEL